VLLSLATLALLSNPLQAALAAEPLAAFVSLLPQWQFVERIAGDAVNVEVLRRLQQASQQRHLSAFQRGTQRGARADSAGSKTGTVARHRCVPVSKGGFPTEERIRPRAEPASAG